MSDSTKHKIKISSTEKKVLIFAGFCAIFHLVFTAFQLIHPDYLSWITILDYLLRWVQLPWLLPLAIAEEQRKLSPVLQIFLEVATITVNGGLAHFYFSRRISTESFVDISIEKELRPDEKVLWNSRPPQGILVHPHFIIVAPVIVAFSVVLSIIVSPFFLMFPVFALPLWVFVDPLVRKHQRYFITNQRALIFDGEWPRLFVTSIENDAVRTTVYKRSWGGWIRFLVAIKKSPFKLLFFELRMRGLHWPYVFRPWGRFWMAFTEDPVLINELFLHGRLEDVGKYKES